MSGLRVWPKDVSWFLQTVCWLIVANPNSQPPPLTPGECDFCAPHAYSLCSRQRGACGVSLPGKRLPDLWTPKRDPNNSLLETTTAWNAKTVYWDSRYLRESQHWAHREKTVATVPFVDSAAKLSLFAVNMCKGNGCLLNAILGGMVCIRWYQMQALQPQHLPEICRSLTGLRVSRWKGCWHNVDITHCCPPIVLLQHPRLQKSKTSPRHHVWKDPRIWIGWMMGKSWKIYQKTPEFMVNKIYNGFL